MNRCRRQTLLSILLDMLSGEEFFRDLYEEAPVPYFSVGVDGRIWSVNRRAEEALGAPRQDLIGRPVLDLYPDTPAGKGKAQRLFQRFRAGEEFRGVELEMRRADGTPLWVELWMRPIRDADGRVTASRSAVVDITARKQAEEALRDAEVRYRMLVEHIPAVMHISRLDEVASTVYISPQVETMTGYMAREWLEDPNLWPKLLHPEDCERVLAANARHIRTGEPVSEEYRLVAQDGREVWIREESVILRDDAGRPVSSQGIMLDITDHKRAEEALQTFTKRLQALHEIDTAILAAQSSEAIGEAALRSIGQTIPYDRATIVTVDLEAHEATVLAAVVAGETRVGAGARLALEEAAMVEQLAAGEVQVVDDIRESRGLPAVAEILESEGLRSCVALPLLSAGKLIGSFNLGSNRPAAFDPENLDVVHEAASAVAIALEQARLREELQKHAIELEQRLAELRRTDDQRRTLLARLENAEEEERARIAIDVHDGPLQQMVAAGLRLDALCRSLTDPEQIETVDQLRATVKLSIERLRHLLLELHPPGLDQPGGLSSTLRQSVRRLAPEESGVSVTFEERLSEEPSVETAVICYRITHEALANIRKHAGAGRVDVLIESRDDGVLVQVRDDGVGFSPTETRAVPGHLGLIRMQERAELAGGWCRVHSAPGEGTTVAFWLPRAV